MMTPFYWANEATRTGLSRKYFKEPLEERVRAIGDRVEELTGIEGYSDKFFEYMGQGYYSLSTPIWTNLGKEGLPISCNNSYIPDTVNGIFDKLSEVAMMTKMGAGTSAWMGDIRPQGSPISTGGTADGPHQFARLFNTAIDVVSQGDTRRGNIALYTSVAHPDIKEWLRFREETSEIQHVSFGVTITDDWMEEMLAGDVEKQDVMAKIIERRFESGYPYIVFHDTVNSNKPQVYQDKNMVINGSNLCTEIFQPSTVDESFVCCLSSMNLARYDAWKDTDAVEVIIILLDAVMSEYIDKTAGIPHMEAPRRFAIRHRAIGLGSLGLHTALQEKGLIFGTYEARVYDGQMHATIEKQAQAASEMLANRFGTPQIMEGYGRRNATLLAVAPTTSSSFILGQVSPSIEPLMFNYGTLNVAFGKFSWKNPVLKQRLAELGLDTDAIWNQILIDGGSVRNIDIPDHDKKVFATFSEISSKDVLNHAAYRQRFIDQGQSINLMIHPRTPAGDVLELILYAWRCKVKSLYYQRGQSLAREAVADQLHCSMCEA
jgi:ribonucleoside-diphosphate reductase alpha chain